ncbi:uncharacterized protein EMH_0039690 [Eimeria mitis]|uniref:Uncharacterized protein n=1 Tax=Eimeria mitis TaxID=44415 RepID=U6K1N3_9EIME|nr:uncharacterized protein EMH_0039690 [Eimeria mitis]CDJ31655.1 hypothetical protein, conserved [Eimeria mitis]
MQSAETIALAGEVASKGKGSRGRMFKEKSWAARAEIRIMTGCQVADMLEFEKDSMQTALNGFCPNFDSFACMRTLQSMVGLSRALRAPLGVPRLIQEKLASSQLRNERFQWSTGHTVIALFSVPFVYWGAKSTYMTARMRRLDTQEILSDRFTWLHERMLEDEVDALLIQQVADSNIDRAQPLLRLGPSYVR